MTSQSSDHRRAPTLDLAREIVTAVHEPFLVLDRAGTILLASPAFSTQFELDPEAVLGRRVYELGGGEWNLPALRALLEEEAPASELVEGFELEQELSGGARRRISVEVRPLRRGANQIHLLLASLRILPAAGGELQPADDLQRLLTRTSPDLVALHRPGGECVYIGEGGQALLGYSRSELLALRPCDLAHPHDRERLQPLAAGVEDGVSRRATVRLRRKGGEYAWLDITVRAVADARGELMLHSSTRDVTHRQRAEDALRWLSRQTKLILDSAGEGIFGLDSRGNVTFINPAAARELGYEVPDLLGQPYAAFLRSVPGYEHAPDSIAATLAGRESLAVTEDFFRRRDGGTVPVEYTCTPARDGDEVVGAVVTFRNTTSRKEAEETVRRAERLAGAVQAVIALRHEINNPLTTLLAEASLLEMGGNSPEEERQMIESISEQARRIRDAVRRLPETLDGANPKRAAFTPPAP